MGFWSEHVSHTAGVSWVWVVAAEAFTVGWLLVQVWRG